VSRRAQLSLKSVAHEREHCPIPGLLTTFCWSDGEALSWAGVLPGGSGRTVVGPHGRLDLTGPGSLLDSSSRFHMGFRSPYVVSGEVGGATIMGTLDQPGTRGFRGITAVSRERMKVCLVLEDGRTWWLRAKGASGLGVSRPDGTPTGWHSGARTVHLDAGATPVEHLVALLLLTSIRRDELLVIGTL